MTFSIACRREALLALPDCVNCAPAYLMGMQHLMENMMCRTSVQGQPDPDDDEEFAGY